MKKPLADLAPRHATSLAQRCLFTMSLDEFEASTKVSVDEMQRWRERGFLAFDPRAVTAFDDRHRMEVEFVAALVRSGLGDAWIEGILARLPKPYCYDPSQTFYSFTHGQWVTLPPAPDADEVIDEHLAGLADAEDWAGLRDLRDRIEGILPEEETDGQD